MLFRFQVLKISLFAAEQTGNLSRKADRDLRNDLWLAGVSSALPGAGADFTASGWCENTPCPQVRNAG
jgi:hypothetical protein